MLENEIIALLSNRKKSLIERKGPAVQQGDLEQIAEIEAKLLEIALFLDKLQGN